MTFRNDPEWVLGEGPHSDIVISTRARLARSLAAYPFPSRCCGEDSNMVVNEVREASTGLTARFPGLKTISIDTLDEDKKQYLLNAHLISHEQANERPGSAVLLEPGGVLSIMVNEEDHLRIQVLMSGLVTKQAWELADWVDDVLSEKLKYGFSAKYGYLTASVSNVGTGLRVSAMMHLAGLAAKNRVMRQLKAAYDLGVSIRGLYGESSRSVGDFFQVSNEATLGLDEEDIVQRVSSVTQYLLTEERIARNELLTDQKGQLIDRAHNALETLRYCRSISPEKAITLMSPLRLAASVDLVEDCPQRLLNELLAGMRVDAGNDIRAGIERAEFLRNKLAGVSAG